VEVEQGVLLWALVSRACPDHIGMRMHEHVRPRLYHSFCEHALLRRALSGSSKISHALSLRLSVQLVLAVDSPDQLACCCLALLQEKKLEGAHGLTPKTQAPLPRLLAARSPVKLCRSKQGMGTSGIAHKQDQPCSKIPTAPSSLCKRC